MTCSIVCDAKQTSSTNNMNLTNVLAVVCTPMHKGNGLAKSFNTNSSSDIIKEKNPQNVREIHEKARTESKSNSPGSMASNSSGTKQGKLQVANDIMQTKLAKQYPLREEPLQYYLQYQSLRTIRGNLEKWVDTKDNKTKTPGTEEPYWSPIIKAYAERLSGREKKFNDVRVKYSEYAKELSFIRNMAYLYAFVVQGNSTFKWTLLGRIPIETIETRGDGIKSRVVAKAINCFVTDWNKAEGEGAEKEEWQMRAIMRMILNIKEPLRMESLDSNDVDVHHPNSVVDSVGKQAEELLNKYRVGVEEPIDGELVYLLDLDWVDWVAWAEFKDEIVGENNGVEEETSASADCFSSNTPDLGNESARKSETSSTTPATVESNDSPMKKRSRNQRRKEAGKERRRRPQPITLDKADSVATPPKDLTRKERSKLNYVPLRIFC